jgi:hypothetical protein
MPEKPQSPKEQDIAIILETIPSESLGHPGDSEADFMIGAYRRLRVAGLLDRAGDLQRKLAATDPGHGLYPDELASTDPETGAVTSRVLTDDRTEYLGGLAEMATMGGGGVRSAYRRFRQGVRSSDAALAQEVRSILCPPADATVVPLRPKQS